MAASVSSLLSSSPKRRDSTARLVWRQPFELHVECSALEGGGGCFVRRDRVDVFDGVGELRVGFSRERGRQREHGDAVAARLLDVLDV